jgi:aminopeptidase-like protein
MYALAEELFPICRSLTGDGVRETLRIIRRELPELLIHEVPTGTKCFDWTVPPEWNIRAAHIIDPSGRKIVDFADCNLHVVGYSEPVDREISREELDRHLHSTPYAPAHVPYVTSYYRRDWGFCVSHDLRSRMGPGTYKVKIDATLAPGHLTYAELRLPGRRKEEVLLSTYICHPSMANNEVSGPVVATALGQWLSSLPDRQLSYRIVFIPETIGSIVYLSRHLAELRERVIAGYIVTCVGDDRAYSFLPSREGNTLADNMARHVLKHLAPEYRTYSFAYDRGSDERQYCAPGIDLPVATIARSLYAQYPEYHTSADNLQFISPVGLAGGFTVLQRCLAALEAHAYPTTGVLCEPHLGPRGLYPHSAGLGAYDVNHWDIQNVIAYADGSRSLLEIAEILNRPVWILQEALSRVVAAGVIALSPQPSGVRR